MGDIRGEHSDAFKALSAELEGWEHGIPMYTTEDKLDRETLVALADTITGSYEMFFDAVSDRIRSDAEEVKRRYLKELGEYLGVSLGDLSDDERRDLHSVMERDNCQDSYEELN